MEFGLIIIIYIYIHTLPTLVMEVDSHFLIFLIFPKGICLRQAFVGVSHTAVTAAPKAPSSAPV
jgi:hypothetical protein